jgi:hypothetical protein
MKPLPQLSTPVLLGALLHIKARAHDEEQLETWAKAGQAAYNKTKGSLDNEKPLVIQFPARYVARVSYEVIA